MLKIQELTMPQDIQEMVHFQMELIQVYLNMNINFGAGTRIFNQFINMFIINNSANEKLVTGHRNITRC